MNEVWRELLAPDSPLVTQPPQIRDALLHNDPDRKTEAIRVHTGDMSAEAQHILAGVALYHRHMFQLSKGDMEGAMASAEEGNHALGPLFGDVRRLADVVEGLGSGWLFEEAHQGATDLLVDVLEPDAAYAILDRIVSRRPNLVRRFATWMFGKIQKWSREQALEQEPHRDIPYNPDGLPRRPLGPMPAPVVPDSVVSDSESRAGGNDAGAGSSE